MVGLAYRQLRSDLGRSALTCIGIAAVFAVVLLLQGLRQGLNTQLRGVALERGADLIATQAGFENMMGVRSVIPQTSRGEVESVPGVRAAYPMTMLPLIYEKGGRKSPVILMVVDSLGGPVETLSGRVLGGEGEIVIDRSVAQMFDLAPGDDFVVSGYPFEIVGVVRPTSAFFTSFVFSNYDSLIEFYFESDLADDLSAFPLLSNLLIRLEPGMDRDAVADWIEEAVPTVDVFAPSQLANADERLGKSMLGSVMTILIAVAYVAGMSVVGLFMFTAAEGRRRDLGILRALGFSNGAILMSLVTEALLLLSIAVPLGIGVALLITALVYAKMPIFLVLPTVPQPLAWAVAASVVFALVGAAGPLQVIRRLDPGEVFQP